ncbi:hypothetical protein [Streptomyces silvensis]|uniref:Uncharacterized protein n=1 Tax=Streptomyces silvensis TaxID=1765722 RepID=A0A0W7X823_9ACTN|nr:hypothetical protein [Streptomyces silvensis]KUF19023.1 hypothetical protein AT728_08470 [Streptomyces silvensis]
MRGSLIRTTALATSAMAAVLAPAACDKDGDDSAGSSPSAAPSTRGGQKDGGSSLKTDSMTVDGPVVTNWHTEPQGAVPGDGRQG